jgi:hypothetical protein
MSHHQTPTEDGQPRHREAAVLTQLPESPTAQGVACPALPPGTDTTTVGKWEEWSGVTSRLCWSLPMPLPNHLSSWDVRAVVQQKPDGAPADEPLIYLGEDGWSIADARSIAEALIAAVDVGERMVTR